MTVPVRTQRLTPIPAARIGKTVPMRTGTSKPCLARPQLHQYSRGTVVAQANLFSRIGRILRGYTESVLSSQEDPERILDQAMEDMNKDLIKLRQASSKIIAAKKQTEAKKKQTEDAVNMWNSRAELAVKSGQDELAREALKKRKAHEDQLKTWDSQLEQQNKAVDQLMGNTREMENKMQEAKSKKDTLKARAATAKSTKQIQDLVGGLDTSSSFAAFDKMEEKVNALEAEAESTSQMIGGDSLEGQFKQLEQGSGVDDELSKMKKQISSQSSASQGGSSYSSSSSSSKSSERPKVKDAIDMELDALRSKVRE